MYVNNGARPAIEVSTSFCEQFTLWCGRQVIQVFSSPAQWNLSQIFYRLAVICSVVIPVIGALSLCISGRSIDLDNTSSIDLEIPQIGAAATLPSIQECAQEIFSTYHLSQRISDDQISSNNSYQSRGTHRLSNQHIFSKADFFVRHGLMHHSHVALLVPVVVQLCKDFGITEALSLTDEQIKQIQIAALFHDYGRFVRSQDLITDTKDMEQIGANACAEYLMGQGVAKEIAQLMSETITGKDAYSPNIFQYILHECDCLAVLRADDWIFNPKYLHLSRIANQKADREKLQQLISSFKRFLVAVGDSPYNLQLPSGEVIQGMFNLQQKEGFEKAQGRCFSRMQGEFQKYFPHDTIVSSA